MRDLTRDGGPGGGGLGASWALLIVMTALLVGAGDAAFLQAAQTYFTGGFNSQHVGGPTGVAAFALGSLLIDATWALGLCALLLTVLNRTRGPGLQHFVVVATLAVAIPFAITFSNYELHRVLGRMVSLDLLWENAGRSLGEMLSEALPHLPALGVILMPLAAVTWGLAAWAGRLARRHPSLARRFEAPAARTFAKPFLIGLVLSSATIVAAASWSDPLWFGLQRKPVTMLLSRLVERVTDFDGDGFHALSKVDDPAPFDPAIHPFAVDLPSNGIDENGLAGDHPSSFSPSARPVPANLDTGPRRPHVLLIFLESFRADLLGRELDGKEITPFLNRLTREASSTDHAYVHAPNTAGSRAHMFSGSTVLHVDRDTLVDDFKARGYFVAHFSGQDDSFNDSERLMGVQRADLFFDARQAVAQRSSRSTSAGGLQISWKVLNEKVFDFLDTQDRARPLFLYVNFTDTHFPYHHDEVDDILGIDPVDRNEIAADQVEAVWATYANTAANVDRGIEALVAHWRSTLGEADHAIIITSDHGQSFYEKGYLGHGQDVAPEQTRTPLLLVGVGGRWPEPIGLADLRGLLNQNLFRTPEQWPPRTLFVPDPDRYVLQTVPSSARPSLLALRGIERSIQYDFRTGELTVYDAEDQPLEVSAEERQAAFEELIRSWEADRLQADAVITARPPS